MVAEGVVSEIVTVSTEVYVPEGTEKVGVPAEGKTKDTEKTELLWYPVAIAMA
jgi:hypothetical protein